MLNVLEEELAGRADTAGISYYSLLNAIDTGRLKDLPKLLTLIIERGSWKRWRWIGNDFEASSLEDYITKHPPKGIGATIDLVRRLLADDSKALEKFNEALRGEENDADNEEQRKGQRPAHRPPKSVYNENGGVHTSERPSGNSRLAMLRRLEARPDIHARVLAGKLSPHAGMVEAGFRKRRERKKSVRRCPKCGHEW
jgi:hypothetical protein